MARISSSTTAPPIIIDVREPSELETTGRIPGARNMPISSLPDGLFLPADEFQDKFGFARPGDGDEVVFYCRSGVRSRTAAAMVRSDWSAGGVTVAEYPGSWNDWAAMGGEVER